MASLSGIRDALKARLATIDGLRVYDTVPGQAVVPAAVIAPAPGTFLTYDATMDGADDVSFTVTLLVSTASDRAAQDALDAYLSDTGARSIKAAVDGDITLDDTVHFATVVEARNYGFLEYAGVNYLGCELLVNVGAM
jgi:hypothetical protein